MHIPRLVIAGTHSGVGKTTLSIGLMAALKQRNHLIQGYKVGPDYIDPSYHTAATGRPSRNLDRWLLGNNLRSVFFQSSRNSWAVIEGVMGLFDGMSGTKGFGSTADVARELDAPIILIVDATATSRSTAAMVYGFQHFEPGINIAGIIINRVKSLGQEKMLREALAEIQVPLLGCIPRESDLSLPERHLGLIPVGERAPQEDYFSKLTQLINQYIDLQSVEEIMLNASDYNELPEKSFSILETEKSSQERKLRLGIAWDEAFLFYYRDALDLVREYNFDLVPFSPLHDSALPQGLDALMLGGGFPELYLQSLSDNTPFLNSLRSFADSGQPIYAECGGFMYLGESITDFKGKKYPLAGLIPMESEMADRLQGMGYRKGIFEQDNFLGCRGTMVHGHEFHYSKASFHGHHQPAYSLFKGEQFYRMEGYVQGNLLASYLHIHFAGHPELLKNWANYIRREGKQ